MNASAESSGRRRSRWSRQNHPVYLMLSLFALILLHPLLVYIPFAGLVFNVFLSIILLTSVLSIFQNRRMRLIFLCFAVPTILLDWMADLGELGPTWQLVSALMLTAYGFFVTVILIEGLLVAPEVSGKTICQAISAYLFLGISWSLLYYCLVAIDPTSVSGLPADRIQSSLLYFSFTTMTTVGFGDITPVSPFARSTAMLLSVVGPLYLTILVAKLVALYTPRRERRKNAEQEE